MIQLLNLSISNDSKASFTIFHERRYHAPASNRYSCTRISLLMPQKGTLLKEMFMKVPTYGVNRRELDAIFRDLGGVVVPIHRTGEIKYVHPLFCQQPRADGRRKDA